MAQRVLNTTGLSAWTLCSRNTRLSRDEISLSSTLVSVSVPAWASALSSPSITRALSRSACSLPMNQAPALVSPL